jgi:hypothetical protein
MSQVQPEIPAPAVAADSAAPAHHMNAGDAKEQAAAAAAAAQQQAAAMMAAAPHSAAEAKEQAAAAGKAARRMSTQALENLKTLDASKKKPLGAMVLCLLINIIAIASPIVTMEMKMFGQSITADLKMMDATGAGTLTMLLVLVSVIGLIVTIFLNLVKWRYGCVWKSMAAFAVCDLVGFVMGLLYAGSFDVKNVTYSMGLGCIFCIIGAAACGATAWFLKMKMSA